MALTGDVVILRGGGDLATAVAQKFFRTNHRLLVLEVAQPLAIRRTVALCECVYEGQVQVEDMVAVHVKSDEEILACWERGEIPVLVDPEGEAISRFSPTAVLDVILAKKNLGTRRDMADCVVAVGPGFTAGEDVDVVVESSRGHDLGRLIFEGPAKPNTGVPGIIGGYGRERVVHSPADGEFRHVAAIGDLVEAGEAIAYVGETPVTVEISGVLRGLLREGLEIKQGLKIADVDPRGVVEHCFTITDKGRAIAGGVLEAVMILKNRRKKGA